MALDSLYKFDGTVVDTLKYTSLLLTLLGFVGNSCSLVTVISKHCKKSSFTVYLGTLAVVDSCVLTITLVETWVFSVYQMDLGRYGAFTCKCVLFSGMVLTAVSSWLVIALTAERAAATVYPHRFKQIHSVKSGIKIVGIIVTCMALAYAHLLYGKEYSYVEHHPFCVYVDSTYEYFKRRYIVVIDAIIFIIFPMLIISIGNIVIVVKVRNSGKQIAPATSNTQAAKKASRHLVIITLLISSSFIVFTMPACIFFMISRGLFDESNDAQRQVAFTAVTTLMRFNHSTNFFLYIVSGQRFRKLFKIALSCKHRVEPSTSGTRGQGDTTITGTRGATAASFAPT